MSGACLNDRRAIESCCTRGFESHVPLRRKSQPQVRRRLRQLVRRKFPHVAAEALDGEVRVPRNHMRDGGLEVRRALPQHIVDARRLHPRLLQKTERLTLLDRAKLEPVADKRQPGGPEPLRDPL